MSRWSFRFELTLAAAWGAATCGAAAQKTITITIPRHSELTFVQRLNRDGVKAVQSHDYTKAAELFYKAYLFDPADPFTLNNLGYISELEGQSDRASKFYKLAAEQGSNANIDLSNVKRLEGEPMEAALGSLQGVRMRVNRSNVEAMHLLSQNRGFEAAGLLQQAYSLDPHDPFTLNNLGAADEAIGDFGGAIKYYNAAADSHSQEEIALTGDRSWQGKSVSEMAAANARRLEDQVNGSISSAAQAYLLSERGVFAVNENDWPTARQYFMKAYSLDSSNAFSLNNRGYVAERDGDLESADFFYQKAREAAGADLPVGFATKRAEQGQRLSRVAQDSHQMVDDALDVYSRERRGQQGPVELTPRGNGAAEGSTTKPNQNNVNPGPQSSPDTQLPGTAPQSNR